MQTADNNQQGTERTSDHEITGTLWRREALHTSLESNNEERNYFDVIKVLSEVELPSPSPVQTTSCTLTREDNLIRFLPGQSSGTKSKADDIEGNIDKERELKSMQHESRQRGTRREATKTNITEKRRRNKISEGIKTLQTLVPNCNKRHKASILGDAIEYIKFLQMQVQMLHCMGTSHTPQGAYMTLASQPSFQVPNVAPDFTMRPLIGMQPGMSQFGSYVPVNLPIFPTPFSRFPLVPPIRGSFPWGQPRPVLYPQFPLQTSQSVHSTTSSSGTSIPTTNSQDGSTVPGQPFFNVPVRSQGTE